MTDSLKYIQYHAIKIGNTSQLMNDVLSTVDTKRYTRDIVGVISHPSPSGKRRRAWRRGAASARLLLTD